MKKHTLVLFAFVLLFTLLGFGINANSASAQTSGGGGGGGSSSLPAGCFSTVGYSPTTGVKCDTVYNPLLPLGCTSLVGYSSVTGIKCDSVSTTGNFPPGCFSASGYSVTTGLPCSSTPITPIYPDGCTSYSGYSWMTGRPCSEGNNSNNNVVISGVSGPQTLNVNQLGTWTVSASSRTTGGNLSYSVNWGDESIYATTNVFPTTHVDQTGTFTHVYSRAGIYTPTFTVTNENGQSARTSLSVNVGNVTGPSIDLTSRGIETKPDNYTVDYKVTFDGTRFDPTGVTLELSCLSGLVSWASMGVQLQNNNCIYSPGYYGNNIINLQRFNDSEYRATVVFHNRDTQGQSVVAVAKFWGGNRQTPVASDKDAITLPAGGGTSITVTSPNQAQTWVRGTTKTISWSDTSNYTTHEIHLITTGGVYVIANTQGSSYNWTVGNYLSGVVPDGVYTIKVCKSSSDICGSSNQTISITSSTTPSITSVSGPTSIQKGTKGTWTINVGSILVNAKYSVDWGFGYSSPIQSSPIFDLTYPNQGYYAAKFKVTSSNGASSEKIVYITVTNPTSNVTLIYPNGGETFHAGETVTFRWNTDSSGKRIVSIFNLDTRTSYQLYRNDNNSNSTQLSLVLPNNLVPGRYSASVYTSYGTNGDDVFDTSDSYFTITAGTSALSCSTLQQTQQYYYDNCKNNGFENVCFSKEGVYQGCTNNARNDCTANNTNANTNILCSVGATSPTIIASASTGGTISPSGNIPVSRGSNKTFTFTPNSGYSVSAITIDNSVSVPVASSYTFYNVTGSHVIGVSFSPVTTPTPTATISVSPTTVTTDESVRVTWSSTNAVSCTGTGFSTYNQTSGGQTIRNLGTPRTVTYRISCVNSAGISAEDSATFTVTDPSATTPTPVSAPTATFTISGQKSYTYTPGQTNHYKWSSTNADTFSSSYTSTGGSICGGGPWVANTASGESRSYISNAYLGCVWTVTYTARNSQTGQSASDTVVVSVVSPTSMIPNTVPLLANVIGATTNSSTTTLEVGSFKFTLFLEEGSYGNEVRELQRVLNGAGYDAGNIDGVFGAKVKDALIQFQADNRLKADGIVGYEVRKFLNR